MTPYDGRSIIYSVLLFMAYLAGFGVLVLVALYVVPASWGTTGPYLAVIMVGLIFGRLVKRLLGRR